MAGWYTHTHTQPFNGCFSETTRVSRYQKGKTNMDFSEARDSKWQWHQLGHMQVCTSLQTDNHASTPPLSFFTGRMPFLPPNQQHQTTEGNKAIWMQLLYGEYWFKFTHWQRLSINHNSLLSSVHGLETEAPIQQQHAPLWVRSAVQRHQSAERPILHQISSVINPKIQRRQVTMNVLHPGCARPPRWSPPVLWRRFEDSLARQQN